MAYTTTVAGRPIGIEKRSEGQVYGLFAVALGLTFLGIIAGMRFAPVLLGTGLHIFFLIAELVLIFTSRWWVDRTPLNYVLFALFPLFSGLTITPYILSVLVGYANGGVILINAAGATVFMAAASAVFALTTSWNLGVMGRALFFAVLGLIGLSLLQIFVPSFRSSQAELIISGAGVVIFALFTAYDVQRVSQLGRLGASPFLLALSLYLDIFNLFLYVLRFMTVLYGERR